MLCPGQDGVVWSDTSVVVRKVVVGARFPHGELTFLPGGSPSPTSLLCLVLERGLWHLPSKMLMVD